MKFKLFYNRGVFSFGEKFGANYSQMLSRKTLYYRSISSE